MKNDPCQMQGQSVLKLSEWELANLHLPPVTTVTFYAGTAPVEFLRRRVASILKQNPWLTSRLVKKSTADGVVEMAYDNSTEEPPPVSEHFSVYEPEEVGLSLRMDYEALVRCLSPLQSARSKPAIGEDESAMLSSPGLGLGIVGTYILAKLTHREPQNVSVHVIDPEWIALEKAKARENGRVPFVSTTMS